MALFQTTQMKLASFLLRILLDVLAHLSLKEDNNNLEHFLSTMFTFGLTILNIFLHNVVVKERRVPFLFTHVLGLSSKEPTLPTHFFWAFHHFSNFDSATDHHPFVSPYIYMESMK